MSPRIVAPVSRILSVTNVERSLGFYRDVLGFDVHTFPPGDDAPAIAEIVSGPARIQVNTGDTVPDSTGAPRPRGAAVVFFETDDVRAMRQALAARGGAPTELEKVNWIKMEVFQIHDPDGHTLWFGQSFQQPDSPKHPKGQLRELLPEMPLADVPAGVAYYQRVLGFRINYAQDDVGVMYRDEVTLLLVARSPKHTGIGSCYAYIRNADALHAELVAAGAQVLGEPISHPWGLRDFRVLDLEGNQITFGEPFE